MPIDGDYCDNCDADEHYKDGLCKDCWTEENTIYCEDCGEETDDTLSHLCDDCHDIRFPPKRDKSDKRPEAKVTGGNANIMAIVNAAKRALEKADMEDKAEELQERILKFEGDYYGAWGIVSEYVRLT